MSLPDSWVDAIFGRLAIRYGAAWLRMWEGIPMDAVKADWKLELHTISPESIGYALEHLPADKPPNVAQFKALALNRPPAELSKLPGPRDPIPPNLAEKIRGAFNNAEHAPKQWAMTLRDREKSGETLTLSQRSAWREALRSFDAPSRDDIERTNEAKAETQRMVENYLGGK